MALTALSVMSLNVALSDWSLDPIHDLFYAKTSGSTLFPGNHGSSIAFVVLASVVMAWKLRSLPMGVVLGFSSASLHELILGAVSYAFLGWQVVLGGIYPFGLIAVLAVAVWKGTKQDRKTLAIIGTVMLSLDISLFAVHIGTPWSPPVVNEVMAVVLWFIACLPWYLPRKWFA